MSVLVATAPACAAAPSPVKRITCEGATALTEGHLYGWLQQHLPKQMSHVDPGDLRAAILRDMPLADAEIERRWPDQIHITVRERTPYAMLLDDTGSVALVDRTGRLASLRRDQRIGLWDRPVVRGCALPGNADTVSDCLRQALSFMTWVDHAHPEWLTELSEIRVGIQSITAFLNDGVPIRFNSGPLSPQLDALAYAWQVAQNHQLNIRSMHVIAANRVVFKTAHTSTNTGA